MGGDESVGYGLRGVLGALPAGAREVVTGFEGGPSSGLGFVSPIFSFPLGMTDAIIVKPAVNYLYYEKRTVLGETKITAPALSLGVGYRYSDRPFAFAVGPAIKLLWERRRNFFGPDTSKT